MSERDQIEMLKASLRRLLACLDSVEGHDFYISEDTELAVEEAQILLMENAQ